MITKKDISEFFDLEVEASKQSWEALMKLPVKERIRKRRAIQNVYLDHDYEERTDDNYILIKVSVAVNLSDFKEGECLVLHKEDSLYGIKCNLYSFIGDNEILLEVFSPNMPASLDSFYDVPLLLDRDMVDLREHVFNPFLFHLSGDHDFCRNLLINKIPTPTFIDNDKNKEELDDTIKYNDLHLLPRQQEAILKCMSAQDYYLIQGPPGTGKSYVLSHIILEEMIYFQHRVAVIGPNHMAINNVLGQVLKVAPVFCPLITKVGKAYNAPKQRAVYEGEECSIENVPYLNIYYFNHELIAWVVGLTPHCLYSSRARGLKFDTLIIDEAGQMTIPLALMGMIKAKKVILAGDHKQLPPIISSEEIGDKMKQSVFQLLVKKDNCTMLDVSFRMCEPICSFVSDLFYDGNLKSKIEGCGVLIKNKNALFDFSSPVIFHDIEDEGEQFSNKEAEFIADTIAEFLSLEMSPKEIGVLSPFRAQAANIRRHIRKHPEINEEQAGQIVSDTIDKMQGQEREVIIFSFVAGNLDYMKEMAEFLYNPNKLNVAFSRAKYKLIIVGNLKNIKRISHKGYPHIKQMLEHKNVTFV